MGLTGVHDSTLATLADGRSSRQSERNNMVVEREGAPPWDVNNKKFVI